MSDGVQGEDRYESPEMIMTIVFASAARAFYVKRAQF